MNRSPVRVPPHVPAAEADRIARAFGVRYLLVDLPGGLVGAACLRHLRAADPTRPIGRIVCEPIWVGPLPPEMALDDVVGIMRERAFRCLPVQDHGRLVGIVTARELRRAGLPWEEVSPSCAACGEIFHVRYDPEVSPVPFCLDCLERARPEEPFDEIGVGD